MSPNPDSSDPQETDGRSGPQSPSVDERQSENRQSRRRQDESVVDSVQSTFNGLQRDHQIVMVGALITIVGAFLPWATVLGTSVLGINGDGIGTLILALIAAGVVYWTPLSGELRNLYVAAGAGILTILIGLVDLSGVAGTGIYVTLLGGIVMAYPGVSTALSNYQRG